MEMLRASYLAELRRRRWMTGFGCLLFVLMMGGGFWYAELQNSGSFVSGLLHIFDFPAEIVSEAARKAAELP
ncbi:phosphonate ABC transporter, permease protein PhnE, partial [Thioclava sp. BHET1]